MSNPRAKAGRPSDASKLVIWCRIDRDAVAALDGIAAEMKPRPSRAQLIDLAVQDFVAKKVRSYAESAKLSRKK